VPDTNLPDQQPVPQLGRPDVDTYGIPESEEGLLPWRHVSQRMWQAHNYWVGTTRPDGRPHAVPVWGVWLEERFYFGGGPSTRKARNLAENPAIVVHLENGDDVVILEGVAEEIEDPEVLARVDDAYEAKYQIRHGPPIWMVRPLVVFAWDDFPGSTTRWVFDAA
jgi:general stress protein 26